MRFSTIILAAAGLAFAACHGAAAQQGPETPPVDVATPLQERIVDYDIYTGRFESVHRVEIRARVSGYLDRVAFEDGDLVEAGELLFVIDQRPFKLAVESAVARVESAKASRDLAKVEYERAAQLERRNVGTTQEVDRTQATLTEAEAQVQVAQSDLNQAKLELGFTEIRSPVAGRVSERLVDTGNLITGGAQGATLLTTVVQTDPIYFRFSVSEADYLRYARLSESGERPSSRGYATPIAIRLMDEAEFRHPGKMNFVDNELDPNSGTIVGRAIIDNPDSAIVPGLFGRIKLPASGEYLALMVPDEAVLADQARRIVMVVDGEGEVAPQEVKPGPLYRGLRVIRSGLEPEQRVIVAGVQRAQPGSKVAPNETTLEFPEPPREDGLGQTRRGPKGSGGPDDAVGMDVSAEPSRLDDDSPPDAQEGGDGDQSGAQGGEGSGERSSQASAGSTEPGAN